MSDQCNGCSLEYMTEKKNALLAWEARLDEITHGTKNSNVINIGKVA